MISIALSFDSGILFCAAVAVQDCEHAPDILQPAEFTNRPYSTFLAGAAALKELAGYARQGSADALDLRSVVAIADETLDGVREFSEGCPECAEILVLDANGRKSEGQRVWQGRRELPELALLAN